MIKNKNFYQILILTFWFLFFTLIISSGNFKLFVKKFYLPYIIIGILILLCILFVKIKSFKYEEIDVYSLYSFFIFIFPLLLFLIVKPTNLPTFAAVTRGIQTEFLSTDILKSLQEQIEIEGRYKKLTIKQILGLSKTKPETINEKDISVEGIVYKDENEKEKFILIRFLITCCAADATPLGIEVNYKDTEKLKPDTWVKVKGKVVIEEKPKIYAEEVTETSPPSDPYLY